MIDIDSFAKLRCPNCRETGTLLLTLADLHNVYCEACGDQFDVEDHRHDSRLWRRLARWVGIKDGWQG